MEWTEDVVVDRPVPEVLAAIADERELMRWSAWPKATGYSCAVDRDGVSPDLRLLKQHVEQSRTGV